MIPDILQLKVVARSVGEERQVTAKGKLAYLLSACQLTVIVL